MEARDMITESQGVLDESVGMMLEREWAPLLEHLQKDPIRRRILAFLYQNQKRHFEEMIKSSRGKIAEDTTTANAGYYTRFVFPILRKMLPNLITPDIASVQPMSGPFGAIFYYDVKYGKSKGQAVKDQSQYDQFDRHYSSEFIDREMIGAGDGVNYGGAGMALAATLMWIPVRPLDATWNKSCVIQELDPAGAVIQQATDNGAGAFTGAVLSGTINYSTGDIANFKFTNAPAMGNTIKASYWYNSEANPLLPEGYLDLTMVPIKADTSKYKFRISSEAMDDFRTLHGMDAEAELTDVLAQQMALQIDRATLMDMYAGATALALAFNFTVPAGMEELQHIRRVLTIMAKVSADVYLNSMRGPANFSVFGPQIAARIQQLQNHGDFAPVFSNDYWQGDSSQVVPASLGLTTTNFGVRKIGTLQNKWVCYQDPYFPEDKMLLGYKGPGWLHAGYGYCPYIPADISAVFYNPEDMSLVKGMRTRYARKMLRSGFYGTVTCTGI